MRTFTNPKPNRLYEVAAHPVTWLVILIVSIIVGHTAKGDPTTQPFQLAVYRQRGGDMATWVARGVFVNVGYEPELDASGRPTVSMAQWKMKVAAAGGFYVCEPSGDYAADTADPRLLAWLAPIDEPDNKVVDAQDAKDKAKEAAVYTTVEAVFNATRGKGKPLVTIYDFWQHQWGKPDYKRLLAATDLAAGDFYPVNRGAPVVDLGQLLDAFKMAAGNKLMGACLETGYQNLDHGTFPNGRAPTPSEFGTEVGILASRGLSGILFPQRISGSGLGFVYDNTVPALVPLFPKVPPPSPVVTPFIFHDSLPDTLIINGVTYRRSS